jgi:undecaprenyl diphosphate synthase
MNKRLWVISGTLAISLSLATYTFFVNQTTEASFPPLNHGIQHLALVMDGNRRWARKQGFKPWIGHKKGVEPLKAALELCLEQKIPYLSVFAFSLENFKRSPEELSYLFDILAQELATQEFENLLKQNIKVRFIGDKHRFPPQLLTIINDIEIKTQQSDALTLNILFCYGSQQEIIEATRSLAHFVKENQLEPEHITAEIFQKQLWTFPTCPPDLIIRTGGQRRLSNFLLYQAAYSELQFLDTYWPDVTKKQLYECLQKFMETKRNFGA